MTQSLRKAACRTYALQALNWLLRSVSQPACLHDLLWCFVAALEANSTTASNGSNMNDDKAGSSGKDKKNKKIEAAMQQQKAAAAGLASSEGLFDHPTEDITIAGTYTQRENSRIFLSIRFDVKAIWEFFSTFFLVSGEAIQPLPSTFHGLLQTVSDLMLLLPVGSSLQQIAITCWCIKFRPQDHNFLHQSHVFSTISKILSR